MGTPGYTAFQPRASSPHPQPRRSRHERHQHTQGLRDWVDHWASIFQPAAIEWCDGSAEEYDRLCAAARRRGHVHAAQRREAPEQLLGALRSRRRRPGRGPHVHLLGHRATTRARRTTGATRREMRADMLELFTGAMRGRTMYVVPFSMGPLGSPIAHIGVQLTDSAYVAVTMRIMTRMGQAALDVLGPTASSCRASTRSAAPLDAGRRPTCRGRATPRTSTSSTSPRRARSGRTARATAATPCSARSASRCASPR